MMGAWFRSSIDPIGKSVVSLECLMLSSGRAGISIFNFSEGFWPKWPSGSDWFVSRCGPIMVGPWILDNSESNEKSVVSLDGLLLLGKRARVSIFEEIAGGPEPTATSGPCENASGDIMTFISVGNMS